MRVMLIRYFASGSSNRDKAPGASVWPTETSSVVRSSPLGVKSLRPRTRKRVVLLLRSSIVAPPPPPPHPTPPRPGAGGGGGGGGGPPPPPPRGRAPPFRLCSKREPAQR